MTGKFTVQLSELWTFSKDICSILKSSIFSMLSILYHLSFLFYFFYTKCVSLIEKEKKLMRKGLLILFDVKKRTTERCKHRSWVISLWRSLVPREKSSKEHCDSRGYRKLFKIMTDIFSIHKIMTDIFSKHSTPAYRSVDFGMSLIWPKKQRNFFKNFCPSL